MRDDQRMSLLGTAPKEYDPSYFNQVFRRIEIYVLTSTERGPINVSAINIQDLPTSATGLRSGDLWNDSNTVKIVP